MITEDLYRKALSQTLSETDFKGFGVLQRGKVRDCYVAGGQRAIVVSDRLSAFDRIVATIPFKGQVLNGISSFWLEQTKDVCPNHLIRVADPAVSVVHECQPFPIEMVVRGFLTGSSPTSIWTHYADGARTYCGHALADGLTKHARLPRPLVTPTTKAETGHGHDEPISASQAVEQGLVGADEFEQLSQLALDLFAFGQKLVAERGLVLVDTKYEFGRMPDGRVVLIDEAHTPDSSRYWYEDSYRMAMAEGGDPKALDKEYVRRYLGELGYRGDGDPPPLPDDVRIEAARRYVEIYEQVTGRTFEPNLEAPLPRITKNLEAALSSSSP